MSIDIKKSYRDYQIERIRDTAHNVAARLRKVADDVDRAADRENYVGIPDDVISIVMWGLANAQVDSPARQLAELVKFDASVSKEEK